MPADETDTPATTAKIADPTARITRDDIEAGMRSVVGEAEQKAESTAKRLVPIAIGATVLVLFVAYRIGKRVGTTKSTVVEIRRI